jgi:hypothetical protein
MGARHSPAVIVVAIVETAAAPLGEQLALARGAEQLAK